MKDYNTLPYQLELPFEGYNGYCPICNPSGDKAKDCLRSMCDRHLRGYEASFDADSFNRDVDESLEKLRREMSNWHQHGVRFSGNQRYR